MVRRPSASCLRLHLLLAILFVGLQASAPAQTLTPSQALAPALRLPSGLAFDAAGNLYIADADRQQVFKVSAGGAVTLIAGDGTQGFAGDGGAATSASLDRPSALTVGSDGSLYIADTGNARVRRVLNGIITTVAGTGAQGFNGDGPAAKAALCKPAALAFTPGDALLIADSCNHRIRSLLSGTLTTVAGTGVQGFTGDGASALTAELDTPLGLAVAADGSVLIADSHNNRIRRIDRNGNISTVAGAGTRAYSGDGGPALTGALNHPRGLAFDSSGNLFIADADNQRLRLLSPSGTLTTAAGTAAQGFSADNTPAASAFVSEPRAVAASAGGTPALTDRGNRLVRIIATDSALYTVPATPARRTLLTLATSRLVYGSASFTSQLTGTAPPATGSISLLSAAQPLSTAGAAATLTLDASHLTAGPHTLSATYTGDLLHSSAVSQPLSVTVTPLTIAATATPLAIRYGDPLPVIAGTLQGVLSWDTASVAAIFATSAQDLSPAGSYPITASLSGPASGNYSLPATAVTGELTIAQAPTVTALTQPAATYTGMPVTLTASVVPATRGFPTGQVRFLAAGAVIATATLDATAHAGTSWLSPSGSSQSITAVYIGDSNFLSSTSSATSITLQPQPAFVLNSPASAQTVAGGSSAVYTLTAAASPAPFSGAVQFSVTGLPSGSKATFAPPTVVPGTSSASTTLTVTTPASYVLLRQTSSPLTAAVLLLMLPLALRRRSSVRRLLAACVCTALLGVTGCGARTLATSAGRTYTLTVTGTGTDLTGAVVARSTQLTLTVD